MLNFHSVSNLSTVDKAMHFGKFCFPIIFIFNFVSISFIFNFFNVSISYVFNLHNTQINVFLMYISYIKTFSAFFSYFYFPR